MTFIFFWGDSNTWMCVGPRKMAATIKRKHEKKKKRRNDKSWRIRETTETCQINKWQGPGIIATLLYLEEDGTTHNVSAIIYFQGNSWWWNVLNQPDGSITLSQSMPPPPPVDYIRCIKQSQYNHQHRNGRRHSNHKSSNKIVVVAVLLIV